jgi:hydroxylaminobenzene mutase
MSDGKRRLLWHGVVLVLLGLLSGALIPHVTNARMGLSAHLAGIQNGLLLAIVGLAWSELHLAEGLARATFWLLVYAMYATWAATLLGAAFGTSRATPIAGAGFSGAPWQEAIVTFGLFTGSFAVLAGVLLALYGLGRRRREQG